MDCLLSGCLLIECLLSADSERAMVLPATQAGHKLQRRKLNRRRTFAVHTLDEKQTVCRSVRLGRRYAERIIRLLVRGKRIANELIAAVVVSNGGDDGAAAGSDRSRREDTHR